MRRFNNRGDPLRKRDAPLFSAFAGLKGRAYRPWWLSPCRWELGGVKWYAWPIKGWTEVWAKLPSEKFARLVRVLQSERIDFYNNTYQRRLFMSVFDHLPGDDSHGLGDRLPVDPEFVKQCAALWEYLTKDTYDGRNKRERSSLTVRVESGTFKLWLSEPTRSAGLEVTGETFAAALAALEERLTSAAAGWRVLPPKKGGKR
jgi:hypothetical protein